ncbi:diguanylate cyclase [Hydrocarboniclastica marina]|uniref:Diguanylate cyclase n=1 Tax=Hydrocarboniclastica marina TaxID=2259620 RepID=A0A4P7XLE4_9ALTE|nr:diguanylate cyclase [Hydrocarboniclastica marina]
MVRPADFLSAQISGPRVLLVQFNTSKVQSNAPGTNPASANPASGDPTGFPVNPLRRPTGCRASLGWKLAIVAGVFLGLWLANAAVGHLRQAHVEAFTAQLNDAGKLRMYSQRIALLASTCDTGASREGQRCRQAVGDAVEQYEAKLAAVRQSPNELFLGEDQRQIQRSLQALEADWEPYRAAAQRFGSRLDTQGASSGDESTEGEKTEGESAAIYLGDHADAMLAKAESLVELLVAAHRRAQEARNTLDNLLQLVGLLLLVLVAIVGYRQGIKPLREIVRLARQTSQGNYQGRVLSAPGDEIGELAYAFNEASLRTEQLIGDLGAEVATAQRERAKSDNLLESAADGIIICQLDGTILRVNRELERIFGYSRAELRNRNVKELIPERYRAKHDIYQQGYVAEPKSRQMGIDAAVSGLSKSGREIPLEISLSPSTLGDETRVIAVIRDATERERAAADKARLVAILDATPDVTVTFTADGEMVYLNPAGRELVGLQAKDSLKGLRLEDMLAPDSHVLLYEQAVPMALELGSWSGEMMIRDHGGHDIAVSQSIMAHPCQAEEPQYLSLIARDISVSKKQQQELTHRATHDALTGLANRMLFEDRLDQALLRADRSRTLVAVLFIDLDNFKPVNDTLGHAVGDRLLKELAQSLKDQLRSGDTKARLGGDEFAVILEGLESAEAAQEVVEELTRALNRSVRLDGHELLVTTSIGVSLYPDDAATAETLLLTADAAMYEAKAAGRNGYRFFNPA